MAWEPNIIKPITVIYPESDVIKGYFKKRMSDNTVPFTEIGENFEYKGSGVHELLTSFEEGEYMIKTINETTGHQMHIGLSVFGNLKDEICGCVTESTNEINSTLSAIESGIKQVVREVSDEVNENQTILEKTGFKVVV